MQFTPEGVIFTTTGTSTNVMGGSMNGINYSMIMYSDHVTDLSGNIIFSGTSGVFSHNGNNFAASPVTDGMSVKYIGKC